MLVIDPFERITAEGALNHPYMKVSIPFYAETPLINFYYVCSHNVITHLMLCNTTTTTTQKKKIFVFCCICSFMYLCSIIWSSDVCLQLFMDYLLLFSYHVTFYILQLILSYIFWRLCVAIFLFRKSNLWYLFSEMWFLTAGDMRMW